MTGPDEAAGAGLGHLRAAQADREQVIASLKAAFVQGRLDKAELDARVSQALASKTYAELAALTADLPAVPVGGAGPAGVEPSRKPARTLAIAARRSGICMLAAVALTEGAFLADNGLLLVLAFFAFMAASGFLGYGIVDAWQERRSRRQLTPRPGQDRRGLERGRGPGGQRGLERGRGLEGRQGGRPGAASVAMSAP